MELAELSALVEAGEKLQHLLQEAPEILTFLQLVKETGKYMSVLPEVSDRLVEVGEAAAILKTSKATVYQLVQAGRLTPYYLPENRNMKFWLRDIKAIPKPARPA